VVLYRVVDCGLMMIFDAGLLIVVLYRVVDCGFIQGC